MTSSREELQEALSCYTTDTLIHINTGRLFCERVSEWMLARKTELNMLLDIKERADSINLSIDHVTQSENKWKAFLGYMKSKVTQVTADKRYAELEQELAALLKTVLQGMLELDLFLDAVEKLAVTSLHVFMEQEKVVLQLPDGCGLERAQVVIIAARLICPLLLEFKRDASAFFSPKLQNVEVLAYQLDRYIQTSLMIYQMFEKNCSSKFKLKDSKKTAVDLDVDLSADDIQRMLDHINQLNDIRMNEHFRLIFLFQEESCSDFMNEFNDRQPKMLMALEELEGNAVKLDSMNKGAKISSVVGSSVGVVGGVLSIVGLALIPVTAGVSLGLTMAGVGLSVTSGANSLVTTATEIGVNRTHQNKANEVFQSFMEDVQSLQNCLDEASSQNVTQIERSKIDVGVGVGRVFGRAGSILRGIDAMVDTASAIKLLKTEELVMSAGKVVAQEAKALRNVPKVAADIPDIGQAALKGPLALSKSARAGLIGVNALFLGVDVFFICKDSISLSKGSETEVSQFIRARAELWRSEIDAWKKMHDSLSEGLLKSEKNELILETPFYPGMEMKNEMESPAVDVDGKVEKEKKV